MPRDTPYSASARLRFLTDVSGVSSVGCLLLSASSSSEGGSFITFDSSVARMISYTPLLNSSTMCNLRSVYVEGEMNLEFSGSSAFRTQLRIPNCSRNSLTR